MVGIAPTARCVATALVCLAAGCGLDAEGANAVAGSSSSTSSGSGGAAGGPGSGPGSGGTSGSAGGGEGGAGASAGSGGSGTGGAGGVPIDCTGEGEFFGGPMAHCYLFVLRPPAKLSWDAAQVACGVWRSGANLAALSSQEEYEFVLGSMGDTNDDSWIGGYDPGMGGEKADFIWSNGEPWGDDGWVTGTAPWKGSEPSAGDDRLKMHDGFEGKSFVDTTPKGYVCESP